MRKIIDGKLYDTSTAKCLGEWSDGLGFGDFNHREESLFRKKTGEYFLYLYGGANTPMAEPAYGGGWQGGELIRPLLSAEGAKRWAERRLTADEYESVFGEVSEGDEETAVTVRISPAAKRRLDAERERTGETQGAIVERLLMAL